MVSLTSAISGVLSQVGADVNVLTIHSNPSQRLFAVFVAVTGHEKSNRNSLIADLIRPVANYLAQYQAATSRGRGYEP